MPTSVESASEGPELHLKLERWIKLKQFVFELPGDYSYAVMVTNAGTDLVESRVYCRVGFKSWFGDGKSRDSLKSVGTALLNLRTLSSLQVVWTRFLCITRRFQSNAQTMAGVPEVRPEEPI